MKRLRQGQTGAVEALVETEKIARDFHAETKAHQTSKLTQRAYDIHAVLKGDGAGAKLESVAAEIDALYMSNDYAPIGWHVSEEGRRQLRQKVRELVVKSGLTGWKEIPAAVEEYALRNYAKL